MTVSNDPLVRLTLLATVLNRGEQTIFYDILKGKIPPPDASVARSRVRTWRLSTLRAWNPVVAVRCAALLRTLERFPQDAA